MKHATFLFSLGSLIRYKFTNGWALFYIIGNFLPLKNSLFSYLGSKVLVHAVDHNWLSPNVNCKLTTQLQVMICTLTFLILFFMFFFIILVLLWFHRYLSRQELSISPRFSTSGVAKWHDARQFQIVHGPGPWKKPFGTKTRDKF